MSTPSLSMDQATAERWVVASAVITAAIYFYRLFTEGSAPPATVKRLAGQGKPVVPLGAFATAWGFTYLVVALMAQAAPALGGSFAILIAAGDLLTNTATVIGDVSVQEKGAGGGASTATTTPVGAGLSGLGRSVSNPLTNLPPLTPVPLSTITSPGLSGSTLYHQTH